MMELFLLNEELFGTPESSKSQGRYVFRDILGGMYMTYRTVVFMCSQEMQITDPFVMGIMAGPFWRVGIYTPVN